jgi:hypothetical protein
VTDEVEMLFLLIINGCYATYTSSVCFADSFSSRRSPINILPFILHNFIAKTLFL